MYAGEKEPAWCALLSGVAGVGDQRTNAFRTSAVNGHA